MCYDLYIMPICSYKRHILPNNMWAVGTIVSKHLCTEDADLLTIFYGTSTTFTAIPVFQRLYKDGQIYFCQQYSRVKRRNSYTVQYSEGLYGQIMYFTFFNNRPAAVMKKLSVLPISEVMLPTRSLTPVQTSDDIDIVHVDAIQQKLFFISTSDVTSYVAKFPCSLKID